MRKAIILVACGLLAGCDYTVPLVKTPELEIQAEVIGLWQRTKADGQIEKVLVLPLGKREYLVSFPAGSPDAMFARACLCRSADRTLVQLEWLGTAQAKLLEDDRVFQFAAYTLSGDTLTIRLLNSDCVKKDAKSSDELAKALLHNKDNPDLFRNEMVFSKVKN
ncbi:MAG: hypothetical protein HYV35_02405 [Lentisphaerae bacterium]|nr:hypothetical protein [Lentisphaerota bacterium]